MNHVSYYQERIFLFLQVPQAFCGIFQLYLCEHA